MTPQEVFDKAVTHLYTMPGRCALPSRDRFNKTNSPSVCRYRGPDDTRCVVGLFIPDQDYNPDMDLDVKVRSRIDGVPGKQPTVDVKDDYAPLGGEVATIVKWAEQGKLKLPAEIRDNVSLFVALQSIHDESAHWDGADPTPAMGQKLTDTAVRFGFNTVVLDARISALKETPSGAKVRHSEHFHS